MTTQSLAWHSRYGEVCWIKISKTKNFWPCEICNPNDLNDFQLQNEANSLSNKRYLVRYLNVKKYCNYQFVNPRSLFNFKERFDALRKQKFKNKKYFQSWFAEALTEALHLQNFYERKQRGLLHDNISKSIVNDNCSSDDTLESVNSGEQKNSNERIVATMDSLLHSHSNQNEIITLSSCTFKKQNGTL
jgi:hypothetical protein